VRIAESNALELPVRVRWRRFFYALLVAVILAISLGHVWAHAIIVESTPKMDGVVAGPVLEIKLRFNARIDGSRSKLTLICPDGISRTINLSQQNSPDSLLAEATNLLPGKYQLRWQVLAGDGHITQGNIPFRVVNP
jgi:methionine-rich copper-binding protein CopC